MGDVEARLRQLGGKPGRYRKRPITIEAMRFTGDNAGEIMAWATRFSMKDPVRESINGKRLYIDTLEGTMMAVVGWWVIKGVKGEFYPCDPEVFAESYEEA